ncbi:hypothetical protein [Massilia sp.]|uniref:hypothetical protein n=1 Tax=Massilia sp. TaxID=1882437 RepID=UPI00352E1845
MKTLAPLLAVLLAVSAPAFAGPCVVLDYQEMKDMTANELAKEYCKLWGALGSNMDDTMSNLQADDGPKPFPTAHDNFDQCRGQVDRVERILASKGMDHDAAIKVCNAINANKKAKQ